MVNGRIICQPLNTPVYGPIYLAIKLSCNYPTMSMEEVFTLTQVQAPRLFVAYYTILHKCEHKRHLPSIEFLQLKTKTSQYNVCDVVVANKFNYKYQPAQ